MCISSVNNELPMLRKFSIVHVLVKYKWDSLIYAYKLG